MRQPTIVSRDEWTAARKRVFGKEKALSRQRDALAAERGQLPMAAIEKKYVFEEPEGRRTLGDLFAGVGSSSTDSSSTRRGTRNACLQQFQSPADIVVGSVTYGVLIFKTDRSYNATMRNRKGEATREWIVAKTAA